MDFFINDKPIELSPKTKIALTYQTNNIAEIQDRQGTLSNKFKVPRTNSNNVTLENSDQLTSLSDVPYKKNGARINHKGLDIIPNGFAILDDVDDNYNIRVYSGNSTLKEDIKDKMLSDLDLSAWTHPYNKATMMVSRTHTDGYIYALVNFVDDQNLPTFYFNGGFGAWTLYTEIRMRPCFFIYRLILEIFAQNGWTVVGDVLENPEFKAELLPLNVKDLRISGTIGLFSAKKTSDQSITPASLISFQDDSSGAPDAFDNSNNYNPATGVFIAPFKGSYTFKATIIIQTTTAVTGRYVFLEYVSSAQGINSISNILQEGAVTTYNYVQFTRNLVAGEGINLRAVASSGFSPLPFIVKVDSLFYCSNIVPTVTQGFLAIGDPFDIALNVPEINQWDLVKDFMQRYCIIPQTDELSKTIKLFQFKDIVKNIPKAKDLSSKHINVSKDKKEFHPTTYAQKNLLLYTANEHFVGDSSGNFLIDDLTLDPAKEMFTSIFQSINTGFFYSNTQYPYTGILLDGQPHVIKLKMLATISQAIKYWEITGTGTTDVSTNIPATYFVDENEPLDLSFQSLIEQHYPELINLLQKYKKLTATIRWDEADLSELQFDIPCYLKKYQAYFYLNKITNWIPDMPPLTELIRLL